MVTQIAGSVTVGTGTGASEGDINLNDPGVDDDFGKALNAALLRGKSVVVLPGTYTAKSKATIDGATKVQIRGVGNPVVNVDATNTGAVSILDINSNVGCKVNGIEFVTDTWVANQTMIAIDPSSGTTALAHDVSECVFTANNTTAAGFSAGNEMSFVKVTNGHFCVVGSNWVYPSIGVTPFKGATGNGNKWVANNMGNTFNVGLPEITDGQRRAAYRLIDLDREEFGIVAHNCAYAIGLITPGLEAYQLTTGIYYQGPTSGTEESGHMTFDNNRFYNCAASTGNFIHLRGTKWPKITNNYFCFNSVADTAGTGFVKIEGAEGATGLPSTDITFVGNHAHNPGGNTTRACSALYLRNVDGVFVGANHFNEMYCEQAIMADCSAGLRQTLTITAAAADNSLTRSAGSFISDGYAVGQVLWIGGMSTNGASFTVRITEVTSATKIKVAGHTLVNEAAVAGTSVNICSVSNMFVEGNSFKWPVQTPASKRVPVLRLGTTGEFANYHFGVNASQNATADYDGTAAVGLYLPTKGIWNTAALVETASAIGVSSRFM